MINIYIRAKENNAFVRLLCSIICFVLLPLFASAGSWSPEAVLQAYLRDHYPWAEVDISDLQLSAEPPLSQPVAILVEKTPPGKSVFRLEFKTEKAVIATAFIKAFDRVFMTRSAFRRGYVLKTDDIYPTLMETARIPKGAIRSEEGLIGKPLIRSVVPNMPITDAMVSGTPLVPRGRKVMLCIESPAFSIKTYGETKEDAAVGDYVKAVNLSSRHTVAGLLVDENTVRVEF